MDSMNATTTATTKTTTMKNVRKRSYNEIGSLLSIEEVQQQQQYEQPYDTATIHMNATDATATATATSTIIANTTDTATDTTTVDTNININPLKIQNNNNNNSDDHPNSMNVDMDVVVVGTTTTDTKQQLQLQQQRSSSSGSRSSTENNNISQAIIEINHLIVQLKEQIQQFILECHNNNNNNNMILTTPTTTSTRIDKRQQIISNGYNNTNMQQQQQQYNNNNHKSHQTHIRVLRQYTTNILQNIQKVFHIQYFSSSNENSISTTTTVMNTKEEEKKYNSKNDILHTTNNNSTTTNNNNNNNIHHEIQYILYQLIEYWGPGDNQICTTLIEILFQSYYSIPTTITTLASNNNNNNNNSTEDVFKDNNNDTNYNNCSRIIILQQFLLYDLLPIATSGNSNDCFQAQNVIATGLLQYKSIWCSTNHYNTMFQLIVQWCQWYIDYYYYYFYNHHQHTLVQQINTNSTFVPSRLSLPTITTTNPIVPTISIEMYQLGLELLRNVSTMDVLPNVLSICLDHFTLLLIQSNDNNGNTTNNTTEQVQQHAKTLMDLIRKRYIELLEGHRTQRRSSNSEEQTTPFHNICQLHCIHLIVTNIFDGIENTTNYEGRNSNILILAYLYILHASTMKDNGNQLPTSLALLQLNPSIESCDGTMQMLCSIDWIFIALLLSSSQLRQHHAIPISIVDAYYKADLDYVANNQQPSLYDSLHLVVDIVFSTSFVENNEQRTMLDGIKYKETQLRLIPCLMQLAIVLLLCPARYALSTDSDDVDVCTLQPMTNRFILYLFKQLDYHRRKELIGMLLHVIDECIGYVQDRSESSPKLDYATEMETHNIANIMIQSVFTTLQQIAEIDPIGLLYHKNTLIERLTTPPILSDSTVPFIEQVDRHICRLLISLIRPHTVHNDINRPTEEETIQFCQSDALKLLQKLLFGESTCGETSSVVRGIRLATELTSITYCTKITFENRIRIMQSVIRVLLPCNRRMVEPEVGLDGLIFLQHCTDSNDDDQKLCSDSDVFLHLKLMLGNMGLIQMRAKPNSEQCIDSIIGYTPPYATNSDSNTSLKNPLPENTKQLLFGVYFFLRHSINIAATPVRWKNATDWVYALVDTYLHFGRMNAAKNWNPNVWIRAQFEFPKVCITVFNTTNESQRLIVEWIEKHLYSFETTSGTEECSVFPVSHADTLVRRLSAQKLSFFIESLKYYDLSLLIAISLSAAVLKHAYEHSCSTPNGDTEFQRLFRWQIAKIYHLRDKLAIMEAMFSFIESAIRRSLIRKKRTSVVLSDDSSCSDVGSVTVVPLSAPTVQKNNTLRSLNESLNQAISLREAIFSCSRTFPIEILWTFLNDQCGRVSMLSYIETAIHCKSTNDVLESIRTLLQDVRVKSKIVVHIVGKIRKFRPKEYDATEHDFQICLNELSFYSSTLIKLRRDTAGRQNESVASYKHKLLVVVVTLTSSYAHLLAQLLQLKYERCRLGINEEFPNLPTTIFEGLSTHRSDSHTLPSISNASGTTITRLFDFFVDLLNTVEYAIVADKILEVLSVVAVLGEEALMTRLIEVSTCVLHTVYMHFDEDHVSDGYDSDIWYLPFIITIVRSKLQLDQRTASQRAKLRLTGRVIWIFCQRKNGTIPQFLFLHLSLIRQWGILIMATNDFVELLKHLSSWVTSLFTIVDTLNVSIKQSVTNRDDEKSFIRRKKRSHVSSIVGLDAVTFPDFFETILNMAVATTGIVTPRQLMCDSNSKPFHDIQECVALFSRLIEMYKNHLALFPRKVVTPICTASKNLLTITSHQFQFCVDWQTEQAQFTRNQESLRRIQDLTSMRFLKELGESILTHVAAPLLSLCDTWQSYTVGNTGTLLLSKSKISSLRLDVEKIIRQISNFSNPHHLSIPTIGKIEQTDKFQNGEIPPPNTKGLHMYPHISSISGSNCSKAEALKGLENYELIIGSKSFDLGTIKNYTNDNNDDEDEVDDNSFKAIGNWGKDGDGAGNDDSDNKNDSDSVVSLNLDNSAIILFQP